MLKIVVFTAVFVIGSSLPVSRLEAQESPDTFLAKIEPVSVSCNYVLTPTGASFTDKAGAGSVSVSAPSGCVWFAASNDPWITITSHGSGVGNGAVDYSVQANPNANSRSGSITIAGKVFPVTQGGTQSVCAFTIVPVSEDFSASGGASSVEVFASQQDCQWNAEESLPWVSITSGAPGTGNGTVAYEVWANTDGARNGAITIAGNTFQLNQNAAAPRTPVAVFRDANGSIQLNTFGSSETNNSGGLFANDPAADQDADGNTFTIASDAFGAIWANVFDAAANTWNSWVLGGGATQGKPAVAVATDGTAYVAVRDSWNSYWLVPYVSGSGFGEWIYLAGVFSTDPAIAASPDGSLYIVGKDTWNSLWSGRFVPGSGFQGWHFGGGIVTGKPSIVCGTDGVAYIAARDDWNSLWMARVNGGEWLGWSFGGGIMGADPEVSSTDDGEIVVAILDAQGGVWTRSYTEGTTDGWGTWTFANGALQDLSTAGEGGVQYITGRDEVGGLWWFDSSTRSWSEATGAAGPPTAAPR